WKHFLVIIGMIFLVGSCICLIVQIILLSVHHEPFPRRPVFITGVCFAIICDGSTFTYTFSSLIHWRANRINEGQSRTTALGAWYMIIQFIWYSIYGVLYIWFFAANSWTYFNAMLVFDYVLRFLLCLMYTWPPPNRPIDFMTRKLFA
ncbi:uncharacterized protein BYT42DRAFT_482594, partial [Radiomyces spectabilis]|uniref:uncharacterized protein n=1 Tax=Radiomyces spectabilis TaxID=64574 RepID=UPI00221F158D